MSSLRLLVVDDDALVRRALLRQIDGVKSDARGQPLSITVQDFGSPSEALAAFSPLSFDAALLDVRMPEMNGVELARALRAIDPALPIGFVTATPEVVLASRLIEPGACWLLGKPWSADELTTLLHGLPRRA